MLTVKTRTEINSELDTMFNNYKIELRELHNKHQEEEMALFNKYLRNEL